MAAEATRSGRSGIFWMNGVSEEEQPLVFVPGVDGEVIAQTPFNLGPGSTGTFSKRGTRMRGAARRSSDGKSEASLKKSGNRPGHLQSDRSYTKEKVSVRQSAAVLTESTPSLASDSFPLPSQVISETSRARGQVCLKDLCSEDKRRIANLIEELARVSEQREESTQRLKDGQEHFERKIQQLEQQNQIIAHERESLQQQYRECQELLGLYQKYLSQQQAKLNESIAQLSQAPAHNKVLSSDAAASRTSRANGLLFDGSYLSLAAVPARLSPSSGDGGRRGAAQTSSNPASLTSASDLSPNDVPIKEHRIHKEECRGRHLESHCSRCEHCHGSGQDSGYGTQQRRRDHDTRLENGHHDTLKPHDCERLQRGTALGSEAGGALTRPLLGHEDWEEKRHELLLQKMQLETERERLQARLEEQEERLNRQNQQLCQSRLDYSRFQQASQAELRRSNTRTGDSQLDLPSRQDLPSRFQQASLAELSRSNTRTGDSQLDRPSRQDLPSSVRGEAEVHPAEQKLCEKGSCSALAPVYNSVQTYAQPSERSRRGVATSPPKSPVRQSEPTLASVAKTPEARLDFSLVELLDIISPVSAPEHGRTSARGTQRRPTPASPKPTGKSLLTPARHHTQSSQQDLEESQILEDIFFIC